MQFQSRALLRHLWRRRSTRMTSEGIQFLVFTLAIGIAAMNTGNNLFYLLLAMMLSLILISGIVAEYGLRRLEFHRHLPDLLFVNEPGSATLVVKNRKSTLPCFSLKVFDVSNDQELDRGLEIHQLLSGTSRMLSYPLLATHRGRLQLDGVYVATEFPFGLFTKKAFYPIHGTVVVCPEIRPLDESLIQELLTVGHEQSVHRRGSGSDLYNLRLYHAGDDSRSIHWPTTARTSQLTVRETEAEEQRRATIRLSTIAPESHRDVFEQAVTFTASLIQHLADRGYGLQLLVGSTHSSCGQGHSHAIELLRVLGLCERIEPDTNGVDQEALGTEPSGVEAGTIVVVQSWRGPDDVKAEGFTLLINGEKMAGVSHVL